MENLKQRKKQSSDNNNKDKKSSSKDNNQTQIVKQKPNGTKNNGKKKLSHREIVPFFIGLFTVVSAILYSFYLKYGLTLFLGSEYRDYDWTPRQWRQFIDDNEKTILLIGGPHRSGTTIIWKAITQHPAIVGFGSTFETGADYSEGILFQDVYPRFGVGLEFNSNSYKIMNTEKANPRGGLGQYALLPEKTVHWTKENKKDRLREASNLSRLLNRFGPYWDESAKYGGKDGLHKAKVWVEKSPQNAILSSFLEGLYNMPVDPDGTVPTTTSNKSPTTTQPATKFLFVTRHPIANAYALEKFMQESLSRSLPFDLYLRNYVQLHKYMKADEKNELDSPVMWVRLEDFVLDPSSTLKKVFLFLGLDDDDDDVDDIAKRIIEDGEDIHSDPNGKYTRKWCDDDSKKYEYLVNKFDFEIKSLDLGYDLKSMCLS